MYSPLHRKRICQPSVNKQRFTFNIACDIFQRSLVTPEEDTSVGASLDTDFQRWRHANTPQLSPSIFEEEKSLVKEPVTMTLALDEFLNTWPNMVIPGFGFDVTMADLFCIRGSAWLNDNVIRAFSVFLRTYENNTTVMIPPPMKQPLETPIKNKPLLEE